MRNTPTSVIVLSIIGLLIGVLAILGGCANVAVLSMNRNPALFKGNPSLQILATDPLVRKMTMVQSPLAIVVNGFLIAGCIGSFLLRPWARRMMAVVAWAKIVLGIAGTIFSFLFVSPKLVAMYAPGTAEYTGAQIGRYIGLLGVVLVVAYPVCVLIFYHRPRVVDAFKGILPASSNFPEEIHPRDGGPPRPAPMDEQFP